MSKDMDDLFARVDRIKAAIRAEAERTGEDPDVVHERVFREGWRRATLNLPPFPPRT
jgi:hypothetical protein